jgi:HEAT repeat protein
MASRKLEEQIQQLRHLKSAALGEDAVSILRRSLADRANLIVAEAAKVIAHHRVQSLVPDLLAAFNRLFENPLKSDPKCWGKIAIVKALTALDYDASPAFLRGARHIQMEPVMGGQEDAAPALRAYCYLALVQCSDLSRFEVLRYLVEALGDKADPVRIESVRALEQMGGDESILLLRLKAKAGDLSPIITGHVFDALLNLERDQAVPLVAEFLQSADPEIRDESALALGGSRLASALELLIQKWNGNPARDFRPVLLRALSSSRQERALDFLLNLVRTGSTPDSAAALDALKLHEASPEIQALIEEAKRNRGE